MKKLILKPEQIIVPYEYDLGSENILKIYFRIFEKGYDDILPPILVAKPRHSNREFLLNHFAEHERDNFKKYFKKINEMGNIFYLLDGNHRGVAATLCHKPLRALELQNDYDLKRLKLLEQSGEYLNLPAFPDMYVDNVGSLLSSAITFLEEEQSSREILTLRQRVDRLSLNGDLPHYMINRYLKEKNRNLKAS